MSLVPLREVDFELLVDGNFLDEYTVQQGDQVDIDGDKIEHSGEVKLIESSYSTNRTSVTISFDGNVIRRTGSNPNITVGPNLSDDVRPFTTVSINASISSVTADYLTVNRVDGSRLQVPRDMAEERAVYKRGIDFPLTGWVRDFSAGSSSETGVRRVNSTVYSTLGSGFDVVWRDIDVDERETIDLSSEDESWESVDTIQYYFNMEPDWGDIISATFFDMNGEEIEEVGGRGESRGFVNVGDRGVSEVELSGRVDEIRGSIAGTSGNAYETYEGKVFQDVADWSLSVNSYTTSVDYDFHERWEDVSLLRVEGSVTNDHSQDEGELRVEIFDNGEEVSFEKSGDGEGEIEIDEEIEVSGVTEIVVTGEEIQTNSNLDEVDFVFKGFTNPP